MIRPWSQPAKMWWQQKAFLSPALESLRFFFLKFKFELESLRFFFNFNLNWSHSDSFFNFNLNWSRSGSFFLNLADSPLFRFANWWRGNLLIVFFVFVCCCEYAWLWQEVFVLSNVDFLIVPSMMILIGLVITIGDLCSVILIGLVIFVNFFIFPSMMILIVLVISILWFRLGWWFLSISSFFHLWWF